MVDLVTLALNIQNQRSSLPLDVAGQIIIVLELILGLEQHLHRHLRLGWNHSGHWAHSERVAKVRTAFHALLGEAEAEGNVLLVDERDDLPVLAL